MAQLVIKSSLSCGPLKRIEIFTKHAVDIKAYNMHKNEYKTETVDVLLMSSSLKEHHIYKTPDKHKETRRCKTSEKHNEIRRNRLHQRAHKSSF